MLAAAAWHVGMLAESGIPEMLLTGRERDFLTRYAFPTLCATPAAITDPDVDEAVRTYSRPGRFTGTHNVYRSLLTEGEEIQVDAAPRAVGTGRVGGAGRGGRDYLVDAGAEVGA